MSGELKVDAISSSTNDGLVEIKDTLKVKTISPDDELVIEGSLKVLGTIMGTLDTFLPVGSIIPYDKSFPHMPALTGPFVECNGQMIDDTESFLHGYRTRNLNGADVVMDLTWTADESGSYASVSENNVTAFSVGDDVSGLGIAEGSYIKEITGTIIVISDPAADTIITTKFTNDGNFVRGGLDSGTGQKDAFQGFARYSGIPIPNNYPNHTIYGVTAEDAPGLATWRMFGNTGNPPFKQALTSVPKNDGINGEPRTAGETRPINKTMVYIMRIK